VKATVKPLQKVTSRDRARFGGKCSALAGLAGKGFRVPDAVCIDSSLYRDFVTQTGLVRKIHFELHRKRFEEMRWEEIWDAALRIRNMFATTEIPAAVRDSITPVIESAFGETPVAVRSSAAMEDSAETSFAGLHESYVNIAGTASILEHIKLVWASLWSDKALLYRQELGLDVEASVMSVVVQELVAGDASGVVFSHDPLDASRSVIEAVYGLNQALVDGTVEPDRWLLDRETGAVISHHAAERSRKMVTDPGGVRLIALEGQARGTPPLQEDDITKILEVALKAAEIFGRPQDVEWTIRAGEVYLLQSRPITAGAKNGEDKRTWYLTLTRSFENLKALRERIEGEIIPGMEADATSMAEIDPDRLSDEELAAEIKRRGKIHGKWLKAYSEECIPFAHGMRLFGQVYNDVVKPEDPYQFMDLLSAASTIGLERNRMLDKMASVVRDDESLARDLAAGALPEQGSRFQILLEDYLARFGGLAVIGSPDKPGSDPGSMTTRLVLEFARRPALDDTGRRSHRDMLQKTFLESFPEDRRGFATELLDLARASYKWRDDDNIYLAGIEAQLSRALDAGRARRGRTPELAVASLEEEIMAKTAAPSGLIPRTTRTFRIGSKGELPSRIRARQLTGQPAGPGLATGKARVIGTENLFDFKAGEVLVCDAIEPEITFIVPLAAGIVERRGGMLIHGAIIAREYGIPCVTGVPDAARLISTGDTVTVDGYLGIVILESAASAGDAS
jgi:phosphoenolpyruvate synthase/pyruvate phosphate dikinase